MRAPDLLDRLVAVLERGDPTLVDDVLAPGAVVWHNDDGLDVPAAGAFARARALHDRVDDVHVDVTARHDLPTGFVARIELRGTVKATGSPLRVRNCLFVTVEGGRLVRLDEYVDPTFGAQLGVPSQHAG